MKLRLKWIDELQTQNCHSASCKHWPFLNIYADDNCDFRGYSGIIFKILLSEVTRRKAEKCWKQYDFMWAIILKRGFKGFKKCSQKPLGHFDIVVIGVVVNPVWIKLFSSANWNHGAATTKLFLVYYLSIEPHTTKADLSL